MRLSLRGSRVLPVCPVPNGSGVWWATPGGLARTPHGRPAVPGGTPRCPVWYVARHPRHPVRRRVRGTASANVYLPASGKSREKEASDMRHSLTLLLIVLVA